MIKNGVTTCIVNITTIQILSQHIFICLYNQSLYCHNVDDVCHRRTNVVLEKSLCLVRLLSFNVLYAHACIFQNQHVHPLWVECSHTIKFYHYHTSDSVQLQFSFLVVPKTLIHCQLVVSYFSTQGHYKQHFHPALETTLKYFPFNHLKEWAFVQSKT
mgnify:CR=1 FL=1